MVTKKSIWHPFTQEKTADPPLRIVRGTGPYLYDENGKKYLDLISSWWVNLHGHSHPDIAQAIFEQANILEHVIFAGCTHRPAEHLVEKLQTILPSELCYFFFSDNGSTAVEIGLKMAYQYWWNNGEKQRTTFISFEGGYHGDTFGAMSVGYQSGFFNQFKDFLFEGFFIPFPETWLGDGDVARKEEESLNLLSEYLKRNHQKVAAFIGEPMVQGAGGMRMCRPEYMDRLVACLREHGILVIFDEVMTGFSRTGKYFALNHLKHCPDIVCLSKGLTGGALPLALTVATDKIYQAFLADDFSKAFAHGHSYAANPLGCAAALASFDLLVSGKTQDAVKRIHTQHRDFLKMLKDSMPQKITAPRTCGTIVAFNLWSTKNDYNFSKVPLLKRKFLDRGLFIRPLGNTVYLLPPYCITEQQLAETYETIVSVLEEI